MQDFKPPRPILPGQLLDNAVYCSNCEFLEQNLIGGKSGTCFGYPIVDSTIPMDCTYFKNDMRLISVLVFLKSGISIYHKAIVKDLKKEIDPSLLTSFLQAISMFGQELTNEQVSLIKFQKMNIMFCRGKYINGAMIIKGEINEMSTDAFTFFIEKLEKSFPEFFEGEFVGRTLPEEEIDIIAINSMKEYFKDNFHTISPKILEDVCRLKCGTNLCDDY